MENEQTNEAESTSLSTEIDSPYAKLSNKHKDAVDMAIAYVPYQRIAEYCEVEYDTVRTWFSRIGICHEAFKYQSKIVRAERKKQFKQIREVLEYAAIDAATTLAKAAKVPNREGVNASSDILDRVGFKPTDKVELDAEVAGKIEVNFNWPDAQETNTQDQHQPQS